mmetsp:Transcript_64165/g.191541  ORF Transcript_64165/g.191541 Transcript_64165/m.191541 type:complete len:111 (+) Transcript_64165:123-455(+)
MPAPFRIVDPMASLWALPHLSLQPSLFSGRPPVWALPQVRGAGIKRGLYGAKITGGGSGGTVAVLGHVGAGEAIDELVTRYERELGHKPHIFTGSSPGALAFGHLRLRPI